MIFLPQTLAELFACHVEDPFDLNRFPLDFLAAHNPAAPHCEQISTPKIIYPVAENGPICVVLRSQHGAGRPEQDNDFRSGIGKQQSQHTQRYLSSPPGPSAARIGRNIYQINEIQFRLSRFSS